MDVDTTLPGYDAARSNGRPPWVKFHWGTSLHSFKAVVKSIDVDVHLLLERGPAAAGQRRDEPRAVRAGRQLGPAEPDVGHAEAEPHPPGAGRRHARPHRRPATTATPTQWRDIAAANGIADPLDLAPGPPAGDPGTGRADVPTTTVARRRPEHQGQRRRASRRATTPSIDLRVSRSRSSDRRASSRLRLQRPRLRAHRRRRRSRSATRSRCRSPTASAHRHRCSRARSSASAPSRAERRSAELVVTALDRVHRLGHDHAVRTFQKQTYSDVVTTDRQRGRPAGRGRRHARSDVRLPHPDDDELRRSSTRSPSAPGCEWWVDGDDAAGSTPRASGRRRRRSTYGEDLRRLQGPLHGDRARPTEVTVRSWDPLSKQTSSSAAHAMPSVRDQRPITAAQRRSARPVAERNGRTSGRVARRASLIADSSDEATSWPRRSASASRPSLSVRGECLGSPEIAAGAMVEITGRRHAS